MEERARQHKRQLAALQSALRRVKTDLVRLASELEAFRDAASLAAATAHRALP
jgi:hypothetical protein